LHQGSSVTQPSNLFAKRTTTLLFKEEMTGELQEPKANLWTTQTLADVATCSAVSKLTKHTLIAFLFFAAANGTL
jgi:hypothetical protein